MDQGASTLFGLFPEGARALRRAFVVFISLLAKPADEVKKV